MLEDKCLVTVPSAVQTEHSVQVLFQCFSSIFLYKSQPVSDKAFHSYAAAFYLLKIHTFQGASVIYIVGSSKEREKYKKKEKFKNTTFKNINIYIYFLKLLTRYKC